MTERGALRPFSVMAGRQEKVLLELRETTMGHTYSDRGKAWGAKLFVVGLLFTCGIAGCASMKPGEAGEKTVWQLRDQYVKIERQDGPSGAPASPNAHPADVSVDRLRIILQ